MFKIRIPAYQSMIEFKTNDNQFGRRTRYRIMSELLVLLTIAVCIYFGSFTGSLAWIAWSALGIVAAYILIGLASYPRVRAFAANFSIILLDDGVTFGPGVDNGLVLYENLNISRVIRRNGQVDEIWLRTKFGQRIKLRDLENMPGLYDRLARRVKSTT
jgi:hypothetical protein